MQKRGAPNTHPVVLIGTNAQLLAELSARLSLPDRYLIILDEPKVGASHFFWDLQYRRNVISELRPQFVLTADVDPQLADLFRPVADDPRIVEVNSLDEFETKLGGKFERRADLLQWGPERIGIGLLKAMLMRSRLEFSLEKSPNDTELLSGSTFLVVCEAGDDAAGVVAANYAYALRADFMLVPKVSMSEQMAIAREFRDAYSQRAVQQNDFIANLRLRARALIGEISVDRYECVTFFTRYFPWGAAYPETPSTHLFIERDIGLAISNAITAERGSRGIAAAVFIDPGEQPALENMDIATIVSKRGAVTRAIHGAAATVEEARSIISWFPFDLLFISTHCGDIPGERLTYDFVDDSGRARKVVIEICTAPGPARANGEQLWTVYEKLIALDGQPFGSSDALTQEFNSIYAQLRSHREGDSPLMPRLREKSRVPESGGIAMAQGQFLLVAPDQVAAIGTPIIISNACVSWHRLGSAFLTGGARAYIGTLHDVNGLEAEAVMKRLFEANYGRPLAVALHDSQVASYPDVSRRPYVMVGCHFQTLAIAMPDPVSHFIQRCATWREQLEYAKRTVHVGDNNFRAWCESGMTYVDKQIATLASQQTAK